MKPHEVQKILDEFEAEGIVWKGEDGRYRICENVVVEAVDEENMYVSKKAPH